MKEIDKIKEILSKRLEYEEIPVVWEFILEQKSEIERLSNELNQQFIKCDKYMTRNEKAIEYINILSEQDMTLDEKECLLEILGDDNV